MQYYGKGEAGEVVSLAFTYKPCVEVGVLEQDSLVWKGNADFSRADGRRSHGQHAGTADVKSWSALGNRTTM